jgi:hypothetical protein
LGSLLLFLGRERRGCPDVTVGAVSLTDVPDVRRFDFLSGVDIPIHPTTGNLAGLCGEGFHLLDLGGGVRFAGRH